MSRAKRVQHGTVGRAILYCSGSRVLVIDGGRIVEDGSPRELLAQGGRWTALQQAWVDSLA